MLQVTPRSPHEPFRLNGLIWASLIACSVLQDLGIALFWFSEASETFRQILSFTYGAVLVIALIGGGAFVVRSLGKHWYRWRYLTYYGLVVTFLSVTFLWPGKRLLIEGPAFWAIISGLMTIALCALAYLVWKDPYRPR